ncbi:MAG: hypothetical protein P8I82_00650 [Flavobacteriales bacterium]|nr:hypothetical protein [Flavobacteriales bacterium]
MSGEKSCPKCKQWNDTKDPYCVFCGAELFEKERRVKENLEANPDPFKVPLIKIDPKDGYLLVFGKRIIQLVQIVFFGILSLLLWIASILPG